MMGKGFSPDLEWRRGEGRERRGGEYSCFGIVLLPSLLLFVWFWFLFFFFFFKYISLFFPKLPDNSFFFLSG
uniref:Uncharacterized protein n=1 Tax=Octopus bimaculoides TaxID=37653 RepID=A0A0L8HJW8_OCTBM